MLVCSQPRIWDDLLLFTLFSKLIANLVTLSDRRRETLKGSKYNDVLYCGIILNVKAFFFWLWIRKRSRFFDMSRCHIPLLREWWYTLRSSPSRPWVSWMNVEETFLLQGVPPAGASRPLWPIPTRWASVRPWIQPSTHVTVQTPARRAEISEPPRLWTVRASDESSPDRCVAHRGRATSSTGMPVCTFIPPSPYEVK